MRTKTLQKKEPLKKLSPITETILNLCDNSPGYSREQLLEDLGAGIKEWFTTKEVAEMFKVDTRTVRKWKERGWIVPSFKIDGSTIRYSWDDIRKATRKVTK